MSVDDAVIAVELGLEFLFGQIAEFVHRQFEGRIHFGVVVVDEVQIGFEDVVAGEEIELALFLCSSNCFTLPSSFFCCCSFGLYYWAC